MKVRFYTVLLVLSLAGGHPPSTAQSDPLNEVVRCGRLSANLADALAQVAWLSHVPMIGELAQPLPRIQLTEGVYPAKDLLREIARQAPSYQWETEGRVIHFYSTQLREAKFNFLNWSFPRFIMPPNISDLKLTFSTREFGLLHGYTGTGIATTGFGDALLGKDLLRPVTLDHVTGREILFRVANESPTFFTIIVFPNGDPTKEQMASDVDLSWFWESLKGHPEPLYVQPPKGTRQ